MKLIRKQVGYKLKVDHNTTIEGAFQWWLKRKNKHCKSFCPACKYFYRCQEDVAFENFIEGE